MPRLSYGKVPPFLTFANESKFFETYGFLCNDVTHHLEFQWEFNANSGAWGNEGRIHFLNVGNGDCYNPIPYPLELRLKSGRGYNIICRVNCNDFIKELVINYGFYVNPARPGNIATRTPQGLLPPPNPEDYVPEEYWEDFLRGYNM